ncbi:MAG: (2Fe-2S) ferredoxin domain-containing protein [Deltaproteobacteria bacterium]|nr:(2Fe-2S) ferredoxin domain-containing protein [Deltaproteobacteria bacterium]
MAKLTIEDLKKIKEKAKKSTALAREVMDALMEEMAETERDDIQVVSSGCMGMCSSEPNVTVEVKDLPPVIYQLMDRNKMRQVFKRKRPDDTGRIWLLNV